MMKIRPVSITVISWLQIVSGVITLFTAPSMLKNPTVQEMMARSPIPIPAQHVILYAGLAVMIISGVAMLKGKNWGRFLYVIWSGVGLVISVFTSPMKTALIPGFVFYMVIVFFLFRPKANQYFREA